MNGQDSAFRRWRPTKGEGFAFFSWWRHLPVDHQGRRDRTLLSMWGDVQRQDFHRRLLGTVARGKSK